MKLTFPITLILAHLTNLAFAYNIDGDNDNYNQLAGKNDFSDIPNMVIQLKKYIRDFDSGNFLDMTCDHNCLRKLKETKTAMDWLKSEIERLCKDDPHSTIQQESHNYGSDNINGPAVVETSPRDKDRMINYYDVQKVNKDPELMDVFGSWDCPCVSYFSTVKHLTWVAARQFCQGKGLELATARSRSENSLVAKSFGQVWLGGLRWQGRFVWNDQTLVDCPFFAVGENDNKNGNENCLCMRSYATWADAYCGLVFPVVCERRTCRPDCDQAAYIDRG